MRLVHGQSVHQSHGSYVVRADKGGKKNACHSCHLARLQRLRCEEHILTKVAHFFRLLLLASIVESNLKTSMGEY